MNADVWASVSIAVATLVLVIVPGLVYAWYALEHMIDDKRSYERVIAEASRRAARRDSA
jgi:ABC-type Fe3+ transport system permease subunit